MGQRLQQAITAHRSNHRVSQFLRITTNSLNWLLFSPSTTLLLLLLLKKLLRINSTFLNADLK